MKFIITLLTIILSFNIASADDSKSDVLPPCEGQGCSIVATKITLEETTESSDLKIRIGTLAVGIPPNITKVDLGNALTVFRYETAPHIVISTETDETFKINKPTSKPVSIAETLDIVFNKTRKDSSLSSKYDDAFLNKLMLIKKELMQGEKEAFVYNKGKVKIYYLSNAGPFYRNLAWVIDSDRLDFAIRMESDLPQNTFIKMLSSITSTKRKGK